VRVLLMSPVAGVDPPGGDIAYTESLLARPPDGVTYTTYVDALVEGSLVERGRRPKHGSFHAGDLAVLGARVVEHGLRRSGLCYREPYRYLTVAPGAFDLVHAHLFAVRLLGSPIPLVTSSGLPLTVLYEDRFGWSRRHVHAATRTERALSTVFGTEVSWFPPRRAACTMVQSGHYRDRLVAAGADPSRVVTQALGIEGAAGAPRAGPPRTIGFVSSRFVGKGGPVLAGAFAELVTEYPDARLLLIGSPPERLAVDLPQGSVEWLGEVPRQELLDTVYPRIDVLALPTRCDSGTPYVVLEALQRGVPVVASDLPWLDEGLAGPGVRRVPAESGPVAGALRELFDPGTYATASRAAVDLWSSRYSMDVVAAQIGATYRAALAAGAVPGRRSDPRPDDRTVPAADR
jgi:glycosyltransferase involved in cell wall biosynthesis